MTIAPDLRAPLFAAQDWVADLIAHVSDDQLTDQTPCHDFDVRMLLAHLAMVQEKIVAFGTDHRDPYLGHGQTPEQLSEIGERLIVEHVDGRTPAERSQQTRERTQAARVAWTDDVLDTPIQLGWGPVLPGRIVSAIYLMEVLAHGWDLATATGQVAEAPPGVGEAGLAAAPLALPAEPRGMEHGIPFGPVVVSVPDAGPTERLANWTGRVSRPAQ